MTSSLSEPRSETDSSKFDVAVIGLGYVGLTLATALADSGLRVVGVERRQEVVDQTNAAIPHFHEQGLDFMLHTVRDKNFLEARRSMDGSMSANVYIITVGTPLGADGSARLDFMRSAAREVADNMPDGALVMLRSTVKIGTTREVVLPILQSTGKTFMLAMCPERTLEGKAMEELRRLPQIIGADDPDARETAARFFHRLTPTVVQFPRYETAEIIKLVDNTFRDVQFAFANEVARVCEPFGVNAMDVIEGGKLGYPRTNLAIPGLVGGPCLEKDPHILRESVSRFGIDLGITAAAREVNERQPFETVATALKIFASRAGSLPRKVALFGVAFKGVPETNDLRGTMAAFVYAALQRDCPDASIVIYDPAALRDEVAQMFPAAEISDEIQPALSGADILIIANNNPVFGKMRIGEYLKLMGPESIIYDYWNHFSRIRAEDRGDRYFSVGGVEAARGLLFGDELVTGATA